MMHKIPVTKVETLRGDVVDDVHGERIPDPYRWLEDGDSPATREWTAAQNRRTREVLDAVPGRDRVEAQLRDLLHVGSVGPARFVAGRWFFTRRTGDQDQAALYVRDGLEGEDRLLLDPAARGGKALVALDWWYPSPDGAMVAVGHSEGGDEWSTLHLIDVETGEDRDDRIPRTRYASVAWLPDATGFYYTRYPSVGDVPVGEEHYHQRLFFHTIGRDPANDPEVFGEGMPKERMLRVSIDAVGRFVVVESDEGWSRTDLFVLDRTAPDAGFRDVTPEGRAAHEVAGVDDDRLYTLTSWQAPNWQVISRPLDGDGEWSTVIPERDDRVITGAALTRGGIVTTELENAVGRLRAYQRDGTVLADLSLPGMGTVSSLNASAKDAYASVVYQSFVQPSTVLAFKGESGPVELSPVGVPGGFDPASIDIRQVWYSSADGTRVSMFIVHPKGIALDGTNPVYLTGYGGFNITRGSEYQSAMPFWLRQGGVFALPNLRGGSEYGEAWHRGGMLDQKRHTFDDLIGAAEYLIAEGYTRPGRLGIAGGSNGGLLVGAVITQRPDLFRAGISMVPLQDMLRYHLFRIGRLWIPEYGSPDEPEDFRWIRAYSPYHNVREGVEYPSVLLTLGENDSRVDPMHARKMAALLQHATASGDDRPVMLRAETDAGHGQGKPLWMRAQEAADLWGFMCWQLGVELR